MAVKVSSGDRPARSSDILAASLFRQLNKDRQAVLNGGKSGASLVIGWSAGLFHRQPEPLRDYLTTRPCPPGESDPCCDAAVPGASITSASFAGGADFSAGDWAIGAVPPGVPTWVTATESRRSTPGRRLCEPCRRRHRPPSWRTAGTTCALVRKIASDKQQCTADHGKQAFSAPFVVEVTTFRECCLRPFYAAGRGYQFCGYSTCSLVFWIEQEVRQASPAPRGKQVREPPGDDRQKQMRGIRGEQSVLSGKSTDQSGYTAGTGPPKARRQVAEATEYYLGEDHRAHSRAVRQDSRPPATCLM